MGQGTVMPRYSTRVELSHLLSHKSWVKRRTKRLQIFVLVCNHHHPSNDNFRSWFSFQCLGAPESKYENIFEERMSCFIILHDACVYLYTSWYQSASRRREAPASNNNRTTSLCPFNNATWKKSTKSALSPRYNYTNYSWSRSTWNENPVRVV